MHNNTIKEILYKSTDLNKTVAENLTGLIETGGIIIQSIQKNYLTGRQVINV